MPGPLVHLWPGRRIIAWHWPTGGFYVYVQAMALSHDTHFRARAGVLSITDEGKKYGGSIIAQKTFDIDSPQFGNPYSLFRGVMKFMKVPAATAPAKEHYTLTLSGAQTVTDPTGETVHLFCATSTSSGQVCYEKRPQNFTGGLGYDIVGTWYLTTSDPNGTNSVTWEYFAADIAPEKWGKCFPQPDGSSDSLWYFDPHTGRNVDTHQPCPAPPDATPTTHIEGFQEIYQETWPVVDYNVKDVANWIGERDDFVRIRSAVAAGGLPDSPDAVKAAVLTPKKAGVKQSDLNGFLFMNTVPRKFIGLNSDHVPTFDDLPDDDYKFVLQNLTFSKMPKPTSHPFLSAKDPDYSVLGMWPLSPSWVRYNIFPATVKVDNVPDYGVYAEAPLQTAGPVLPAGVAPPSDQDFARL